MPVIRIYSDGSCYHKDQIGGWGAVLYIGPVTIELSGPKANTTSNRMETTAVLRALSAIKTPSKIRLFTDSEYVVRGITTYGWSAKDPESISNFDLWKKMRPLLYHHKVKVQWVKGHSGVEGNERADKLAGEARKALLKRKGL